MERIASLAVVVIVSVCVVTGCKPGAAPPADDGVLTPATFSLESLPVGLDEVLAKVPADNPITKEKIELGRHLYFDKRLSKDGTISCATCHDPNKGWTDQAAVSTGIGGQKGGRSAPTVINRLFSDLQFWDGRAASLEEQAVGPIANPIEMGETHDAVVEKLSGIAGYKPLFKAAFGDETVTIDRIGQAIATFERTIVSGNSPYDKFKAGDKTALSESAQRGMAIFFDNNKGRCSICHTGHNFTDETYHNLGVGFDGDPSKHQGRVEITKKPEDTGAYKTPTLRNIAQTAPYMHDGSEKTLEAVVRLYVEGGVKDGNPHLDPEMKPLELTADERKDLVEFMKALTGEVTRVEVPTPVE